METLGTAVLTDEIPASRAVTTIVSRTAITEALQERSPELYLDLEHGDERGTINITWTQSELEQLLDRASGDDILFAFDRDQLQLAFDDVEAHGLREKALVFTVAVVGAIGSGSAIANAAPTIERDSSGAASIATVQALATDSGAAVSNVRTPGLQVGDEAASVPAPTVQAAESMAAAASVKLASEPVPAVSNAVSGEVLSNVHTPGLQIGPGEQATATPAVHVSANTSDGEFLGIDTRDATEALLAGGVLLAIAGAGFVGTRRPGSARPA